MGLPYYAMDHFRTEVASIPFQDARRRYCLPILDPNVITCEEVPINPVTCASEDNFIKFKTLFTDEPMKAADKNVSVPTGLYKITSPYPNDISNWTTTQLRIDNNGQGIMFLQSFLYDPYITAVGAANAYGEVGYASMLHRLMYDGEDPDTSDIPVRDRWLEWCQYLYLHSSYPRRDSLTHARNSR